MNKAISDLTNPKNGNINANLFKTYALSDVINWDGDGDEYE